MAKLQSKKCCVCKKVFTYYASTQKSAKYCSLKCRNKSYCGEHFSTNTEFKKGMMFSKERNKKISETHQKNHNLIKNRTQLKCKNCDELFEVYPHQKNIRKYCSNKCQMSSPEFREQGRLKRTKYKTEQEKHLANSKNKRIFARQKFKNDMSYRILSNLRTRLWKAVKSNVKSASTKELLGCTVEFLKKHLQSKFKSGMSFENYGKWHVDHIKPCIKFDLSKPEEQHKCFHYTNLQPLWAKENWKKGCKYKSI